MSTDYKVEKIMVTLKMKGMNEKEAKRNALNHLKKKYPKGVIILNNYGTRMAVAPHEAVRCSTANASAGGAKKWETKYKLLLRDNSGMSVQHPEKFDLQGDAVAKAKEIVREQQCAVILQVEKVLVGQDENLKIFTPSGAKLGTWELELEIAVKEPVQ